MGSTPPGEGSLNAPPPGQNYKAFGLIGALDDFDRQCFDMCHSSCQLFASISAIGKEFPHRGVVLAGALDQIWRTVAA